MDLSLFQAVHGWAASGAVTWLATFLSSQWVLIGVCVPLGLYLLWRRRLVAMLSVALAMGSADAITARVFKPLINRERPCRVVQDVLPVAKCGSGRSMPSGHASVAFAFAGSVGPLLRFGWLWTVPLAAGVALSRVILGVHYPSDILFGGLFGLLLGSGLSWGRRRFETNSDAPQSSEAGEAD